MILDGHLLVAALIAVSWVWWYSLILIID